MPHSYTLSKISWHDTTIASLNVSHVVNIIQVEEDKAAYENDGEWMNDRIIFSLQLKYPTQLWMHTHAQ